MFDIKLKKAYEDAIYNYRPPWVQKWGITYVFIFMLIIIVGSNFISYPDVVSAKAEISTINPPVHLMANVNGKINRVLVDNNTTVKKGIALLLLESSANWEDILYLKNTLAELSKFAETGSINRPIDLQKFSGKLSLGSLQSYYADFVGSYHELAEYYSFGYNLKEIEAKEQQLEDMMKVNKLLVERKQIINNQLKVGLDQMAMDSLDYSVAGVSKYSFNERKQTILNTKGTVNDAYKEEASNLSSISQLKYEIQSFKIKNEIEEKRLLMTLKQKLQILQSNLDTWEKSYVIESPVNGKVNFASIWAENQNVKAGEIVVSVIPNEKARAKVRVQFPIQKSGKVKNGQKVNIKLDNFPFNEYGMLRGKIDNKSDVPNNIVSNGEGGTIMMYSADVKLDNGLVTSYKVSLPLVQEMYGSAEILTDNTSLLMRFLSPLKAVFDERVK
jgi:multidrug resistance efflux pump